MRYLLEDPIPLAVALGCVAFGLLLAGMRRRQRGFFLVAGVAVVAGAGVVVVANSVVTPREAVEQRTRQLVAATAPLDAATLDRLIAPDAAVLLIGGIPLPMQGVLSEELTAAVRRHDVSDQSIRALDVRVDPGGTATARLELATTLAGPWGERPVHTTWRLTWRRAGDDPWRLTTVEWLEFERRTPSRDLWQGRH